MNNDFPELPFNVGPKVWTVTQVGREIQSLLRGRLSNITIEAEVGSVTRSGAGHVYITLKEANDKLNCAMFRNHARLLQRLPEEGDMVRIKGSIDIYQPRSYYQFIATGLEFVGAGALLEAFERMKAKLKAEGLFDSQHKKTIPKAPGVIGIVTSPTGAALHDMVRVITARMPSVKIIISPSRVQGEGSAAEVISALSLLERRDDIDVIIIGRGGGSIEDLWAFNDEALARAIFNCSTPIISAVGHEVDFTIADLVADVRAATPSHAGELVVPDGSEMYQRLDSLGHHLDQKMLDAIRFRNYRLKGFENALRRAPAKLSNTVISLDSRQMRLDKAWLSAITTRRNRLEELRLGLTHTNPQLTLADTRAKLDTLGAALPAPVHMALSQTRGTLESLRASLHALNPKAVLARGCAIALDASGIAITSAAQLAANQQLSLVLHQGKAGVRVETVED